MSFSKSVYANILSNSVSAVIEAIGARYAELSGKPFEDIPTLSKEEWFEHFKEADKELERLFHILHQANAEEIWKRLPDDWIKVTYCAFVNYWFVSGAGKLSDGPSEGFRHFCLAADLYTEMKRRGLNTSDCY